VNICGRDRPNSFDSDYLGLIPSVWELLEVRRSSRATSLSSIQPPSLVHKFAGVRVPRVCRETERERGREMGARVPAAAVVVL
jgi:hypothetical protein